MRLDTFLNDNFNTGREKAKELIKNSKVLVDDKIINKPSFEIINVKNIIILDDDYNKYVSRGAYKLVQAIDEYSIIIKDKKCLDVGSSTGGFTDVLLQNDAEIVFSVDTGKDQLHHKLKENIRVKSFESTNILNFTNELYGLFDIVTCDVSFVSIKKLLPHLTTLLNKGSDCVFLVKPQFEVGKNKLNKKGIVKDNKDRENALKEVVEICKILGFENIRSSVSKTVGHGGNIEYLLVCQWG